MRYQLESGLERMTPAERAARGKEARAAVPRDSHAFFDPGPGRPDPVELLEDQAKSRVPELVPVRGGRMMVSPFTFYRGAALPMAADLAGTPVSGLAVQACGDAHLSNFAVFDSAERRLVFDVNDFDETTPGPWEWDVKRLAASLEIAARGNGFCGKDRRAIVTAALALNSTRPSIDSQRPSRVCTLFAIATWVCRSGSPARLSRWVNAVATRPRTLISGCLVTRSG